ncbi:FMN-dependent oxidoreductase (nitrilotriacetate monooxygenase family) [Rhodococcus sp. 27YEA15]|uniref:LLM class flavin-dependent oxidoreductase n=1 Tax=Rhodococcus sp. 27YEA15 TaxID=3156259 RepID=UPI003C7E4D37
MAISSSADDGRMRLAAFMNAGPGGVGGWRHPLAEPGWFSMSYYQNIGRILEAGRFDLVFFADSLSVPRSLGDSVADNVRYGVGVPRLDPIPVITLIAAATEHLGLAATSSTGFQQPFNTARTFASLDHLTEGRAAWNVVTSFQDAEARNFGLDRLPPREVRYAKAEEFLQVTAKLWDSWADDALVLDKDTAHFARPERVSAINHAGEHFRVQGPSGVPRSPQGYPVIIQAGSSPAGRDVAARWADVIFCSHESIESAIDFRADVRRRAAAHGRDPDHVKILPAVTPIVGTTAEHANERREEFEDLVPAEAGLSRLAYHLDVDLSQYELDEPLPPLDVQGVDGHYREVVEVAAREGFTVRQLGKWYGARTEGNLVGTTTQIADRMEEWFTRGAADGFTVCPTHTPVAFEDFTANVVPELQRRGLFREEYEGRTLRENLGVPRPEVGQWNRRAIRSS